MSKAACKWSTCFGLLLLAALFVVTINGPAANAANSKSATKTLKLGVIAPLSGPGAAWGIAVEAGAEIAADDVNARGGLKVNGQTYKVKVIPYDSKYTPQGSVTAANRLMYDDNVKFIIGPLGSAGTLAVQEISEPNKVILMCDSFTSKTVSPKKPYTFRVEPTLPEIAGPTTKWIAKHYPKWKKVAILSPNDETGWDMEKQIRAAYTSAGFKIVFSDFYQRGTQDYSTILAKVMQKKPDILELGGSSPGDSALIVKQARDLGFKGHLVKLGGEATKVIMQVAGAKALEGFLHYTPCDPNRPALIELNKKYKEKYKGTMPGTTPYFYDGTNILFKAIQAAGTTTNTDAVAKALRAMKSYNGVTGKSHWGGMSTYGINQQLITGIYVGRIENGKDVAIKVQ